MYPIHDRISNIIIQELLLSAIQICPGPRPKLMFEKGRDLGEDIAVRSTHDNSLRNSPHLCKDVTAG